MKVLGIDPGKTTGYSLINVEGKKITTTTNFGWEKEESVKTIQDLLKDGEVDLVVCESFLIRPDKARLGHFDNDSMVAPRVIGKIEMLCELTGTQLKMQPPSIKPAGYGFANLEYKKGAKNKHWQDAYCHAVYYAVKHLHAYPVVSGKTSN